MGFGARLPTPPPDAASDVPAFNPKALDGLSTPDLTAYGLIPEFLGRLPIISTLHPLSVADLVRILSEPRNALIKQYQATFQSYDSELRFTQKALEAIASEGLKRGGGARGLRGVLEEVLQDAMFEVPGSVSAECRDKAEANYRAYDIVSSRSRRSKKSPKCIISREASDSCAIRWQNRRTQYRRGAKKERKSGRERLKISE